MKRGRGIGASGYPGVWPAKTPGKWLAVYRHKNRQIYVGTYDRPDEAYKAWLEKGFEIVGEYPDAGKNYSTSEQRRDIENLHTLRGLKATPLERNLETIDRYIKEAL